MPSPKIILLPGKQLIEEIGMIVAILVVVLSFSNIDALVMDPSPGCQVCHLISP